LTRNTIVRARARFIKTPITKLIYNKGIPRFVSVARGFVSGARGLRFVVCRVPVTLEGYTPGIPKYNDLL
jgi:hypothetical protein